LASIIPQLFFEVLNLKKNVTVYCIESHMKYQWIWICYTNPFY